jgi:hypothetical protein
MANNSEEGQGSQRAVVPVMMMIDIYKYGKNVEQKVDLFFVSAYN